jgi:hypothetical protein
MGYLWRKIKISGSFKKNEKINISGRLKKGQKIDVPKRKVKVDFHDLKKVIC